jgi:hypothetical protein
LVVGLYNSRFVTIIRAKKYFNELSLAGAIFVLIILKHSGSLYTKFKVGSFFYKQVLKLLRVLYYSQRSIVQDDNSLLPNRSFLSCSLIFSVDLS